MHGLPDVNAAISALTGPVLMVKAALLVPAKTVTVVGTEAAGLLLVSCTSRFTGAGPLSVTVPVAGLEPTTEAGLIFKEETVTVTGVRMKAW